MFSPFHIPPCHQLHCDPSTPGIVSRLTPLRAHPLCSSFPSRFSRSLPPLLSLRHRILLPLTVASHSKYSFFFYASLSLFPHYTSEVSVRFPFLFSFPVTLEVTSPVSFLPVPLGFSHLLSFFRTLSCSECSTLLLSRLRSSLFIVRFLPFSRASFFFDFYTPGLSL